jgi:hypothetical protein
LLSPAEKLAEAVCSGKSFVSNCICSGLFCVMSKQGSKRAPREWKGITNPVTLLPVSCQVPSVWMYGSWTFSSSYSSLSRTYGTCNSSRVHHLTLKSHTSFFALTLWGLLSLGRPLFRSLWDLMVASARSDASMNPRRHRRFAPEGEIWEMEIRDRSS